MVLEFLLHRLSSTIGMIDVWTTTPVAVILGLIWQHRRGIGLIQLCAKVFSLCPGGVLVTFN